MTTEMEFGTNWKYFMYLYHNKPRTLSTILTCLESATKIDSENVNISIPEDIQEHFEKLYPGIDKMQEKETEDE